VARFARSPLALANFLLPLQGEQIRAIVNSTSSGCLRLFSRLLTKNQKTTLKSVYFKVKGRTVRLFASYGPEQLEARFRKLGIREGDAVLMHSSFDQFNGFRGTPGEVIDSMLNVIGPGGHLFMLSMAYHSSSYDYLRLGVAFDVRKTFSRMGIITEVFRRRPHVVRSANPLHPILALGPKAAWIISGHDELSHSCGPGSPFEKMIGLNTKMLFFGVGFETCTFMHYLEDRFQESAPVSVYHHGPLEAVIIDGEGTEKRREMYVFAPEAIQRRNFLVFERMLVDGGCLRQNRIGNTKLSIITMAETLSCALRLIGEGNHFYTRFAGEKP
jgi:aminoglycoside 3-N-acetyltransferase